MIYIIRYCIILHMHVYIYIHTCVCVCVCMCLYKHQNKIKQITTKYKEIHFLFVYHFLTKGDQFHRLVKKLWTSASSLASKNSRGMVILHRAPCIQCVGEAQMAQIKYSPVNQQFAIENDHRNSGISH